MSCNPVSLLLLLLAVQRLLTIGHGKSPQHFFSYLALHAKHTGLGPE